MLLLMMKGTNQCEEYSITFNFNQKQEIFFLFGDEKFTGEQTAVIPLHITFLSKKKSAPPVIQYCLVKLLRTYLRIIPMVYT